MNRAAISIAVERSEEGDASASSENLHRLVGRHELFARGAQATHSINPRALADAAMVWFGVGVAQREPSRGLPVDVLVMLLGQEMVRRTLGLADSVVLIADTNATAAGIDPGEVTRSAHRTEATLRAVVSALELSTEIRAASAIPKAEKDACSPPAHPTKPSDPYIEEQLRQMEWMRRAGGSVKIGWALSSARWDERAFDGMFFSRVATPLCTVYTVGGRTLESRRPRACPYLCDDPARRLLLAPDEDIRAKLAGASESVARGYRRLLGKISRGWASLRGDPAPSDPVGHVCELVAAVGASMTGEQA